MPQKKKATSRGAAEKKKATAGAGTTSNPTKNLLSNAAAAKLAHSAAPAIRPQATPVLANR